MHVEFQMTQLQSDASKDYDCCKIQFLVYMQSLLPFESTTKYEMILIIYSVIYYVSLALIVKLFFIVCVHSHVLGRGNTNSGHHRNKQLNDCQPIKTSSMYVRPPEISLLLGIGNCHPDCPVNMSMFVSKFCFFHFNPHEIFTYFRKAINITYRNRINGACI